MIRENRYIVIKRKHLNHLSDRGKENLKDILNAIAIGRKFDEPPAEVGEINCVVVEKKWPIYEQVWQMIENMQTVKPSGE